MAKRKQPTRGAAARKMQKVEEETQTAGQADEAGAEQETQQQSVSDEAKEQLSSTDATKRGRKKKVEEEPVAEVLQQGRIYFFYRPKVGLTEVHSAKEVQRLFMVLEPFGSHVEHQHVDTEIKRARELTEEFRAEEKRMRDDGHTDKADLFHKHARDMLKLLHSVALDRMSKRGETAEEQTPAALVVIGNKRLPNMDTQRNAYCFVDLVGSMDEIHQALDVLHYDTATRGERTVEAARPVAEGLYRLVSHTHSQPSKSHTSLVYALQLPTKIGDAQRAFNLEHDSSLICVVRNPMAPSDRGIKTKADLPNELLEAFGPVPGRTRAKTKQTKQRTFAALQPEFLLHKNVEFLMIKTSKSPIDEFGDIAEELLNSALDELHDAEQQTKGQPQEKLMASVGLGQDSEEHPTEALVAGTFV